MKVAIVGPGRMGAAVSAVAQSRGHQIVAELGATQMSNLRAEALAAAPVAIEFTRPDVAGRNVDALIDAGVHVVCGTTGWFDAAEDPSAIDRIDSRARAAGVGAIVAPNFSPGMHLFYRVVREAARTFGSTPLYEGWLHESHHRGKRDAPSGTARRLSELLLCEARAISEVVEGNAVPTPPPAGALHVTATRVGYVPGTHEIGFDGVADSVTLTHRARGRDGFALGAPCWRRNGWNVKRVAVVQPFDEVIEALLAGAFDS